MAYGATGTTRSARWPCGAVVCQRHGWAHMDAQPLGMGRINRPAAINDAAGTFISHKRARRNEPTPREALGEPPSRLSAREKGAWREIAFNLPPEVAFCSDRLLFEILVKLAAKEFAGEPLKGVERGQLIQLGARFGMTPSDRSRCGVSEVPKDNSLAAFIARNPSNRPLLESASYRAFILYNRQFAKDYPGPQSEIQEFLSNNPPSDTSREESVLEKLEARRPQLDTKPN